jgi:hypothetical protein
MFCCRVAHTGGGNRVEIDVCPRSTGFVRRIQGAMIRPRKTQVRQPRAAYARSSFRMAVFWVHILIGRCSDGTRR